MATIDETHDPALRSWVASAEGHADFPIQNLPFGIVEPNSDGVARGAVAIGDMVLDLAAALEAGLLEGSAESAARACCGSTLNDFLECGAEARRGLRAQLSRLLAVGSRRQADVERCLREAASCTPVLPARIGDYTDFYVGIHHATHVGKLFRPDTPLLPNYKHVPIGYHGRASSILPSGTPVTRPLGQIKPPDESTPTLGATGRLDYELELGLWIGQGNALGDPIGIAEAGDHIAGYCLLNDWSARDVQAWEYQPLGPFLAKNFASTISTWIVTPEALAPFRTAQASRPEGDPAPLPYLDDLRDQREGGLDIELEVLLLTPGLKARSMPAHRMALSSTRHMYWTPAQMVTHHTVNGCNLRAGDLLGTGTISGPAAGEAGSILEATNGGKVPILLPSGEERRFLQDGDEVILKARARRNGFVSIGFGECRAVVLPPRQSRSFVEARP